MAEGFTGFPKEATDFLRKLEKNNNREWFQAHKEVYERACREPMKALIEDLRPRYGPSRLSRINRDMRFARDRPYKSYIAAGIGGGYISLSKDGVWVGGGMYKPDPPALARFRAAVDDEGTGSALTALLGTLRRKGYDIDTHERVASAPKGYTADHPRIDLLRMKDIYAGKMFGPETPWLSTAKALDRITRAIDEVQPLVQWLRRHVGARSSR